MTDLKKRPNKLTPKTTLLERLQWICNTVFHQLVAVAGTFILWTLCYNYQNKLSTWHMILTTIAVSYSHFFTLFKSKITSVLTCNG